MQDGSKSGSSYCRPADRHVFLGRQNKNSVHESAMHDRIEKGEAGHAMSEIEIWKFRVGCSPGAPGSFVVSMPERAEVLTVAVQNSEPVFWAVVDPKAPKTLRKFFLLWTGQGVSGWSEETFARKYVGAFEINGLVWHLIDVERAR
jgi:hypothetical protein